MLLPVNIMTDKQVFVIGRVLYNGLILEARWAIRLKRLNYPWYLSIHQTLLNPDAASKVKIHGNLSYKIATSNNSISLNTVIHYTQCLNALFAHIIQNIFWTFICKQQQTFMITLEQIETLNIVILCFFLCDF